MAKNLVVIMGFLFVIIVELNFVIVVVGMDGIALNVILEQYTEVIKKR